MKSENTQFLNEQAAAMQTELLRRMIPSMPETPASRQYKAMSLLEMAREHFDMRGVQTRSLSRFDFVGNIFTRAPGMTGASDFLSLLNNLGNKRLRSAYDENPGTYKLWARRGPDAPNFKEITTVQLSGAPELLRTPEYGEFKYGFIKDVRETYRLITYGRVLTLSRQAFLNDDLRGFDRLVTAFGAAARRLENRLVYTQLTGADLMSDGLPVFHAAHKNLATGTGSALQLNSLAAGRTAMRLQKGFAGEEMDLTPRFLIVPASLEQTAYQLTNANYAPTQPSDTNDFHTGGRAALVPIVEPLLDQTSYSAWYLAAQTQAVDTVEYCYLDGADGPVIDAQTHLDVDGVSYKCRLDFGVKAIDHRGLYRATGQ